MKLFRLKFILKALQMILVIAVFGVSSLFLLDHFEVIETVKPFVVMSGSMEPAVRLGSVVIVKPQDSYRPGDAITFKKGSNLPITHRVLVRRFEDGNSSYLTSGDANEEFDQGTITNGDIVGRVVFSIPLLGYAVDFAKQPYGFILMVIVPATIVIYEELKFLIGGTLAFCKKIIKDIASRRSGVKIKSRSVSANLSTKNSKAVKGSVIVPIIGSILVLSAFSGSFFSDQEPTSGNIFGAAEDFGGPTLAQTLVIHEVLPDSSCTVGEGENSKPGIWLEVYNESISQIDLKDHEIFDGSNTIGLIHAGSLNLDPGEFALLAHDQSIWTQCESDRDTDTETGQLGAGPFNLNSQFLQLIDPSSAVIDSVRWGGIDEATPAQNESIERVPIGLDSATGGGWEPRDFIVRERPTPGYGSNLVLNEIFPSPAVGDDEWVEIFNPSNQSIDLNGWDLKDAAQPERDISSLGVINPSDFKIFEESSGWLNNSGDTLQLINSSGFVVDEHTYPTVSPEKSTGRKKDRHTDWINPCAILSKGSTNNGVCQL